MTTVYMICAAVGGTLIVIQFVMTLIGLGGDDVGGDGDVDFDHDASPDTHGHAATDLLFGIITFRTIMAGLAFFGLTGWTLSDTQPDMQSGMVVVIALAVGLVAVFIVATIMRSLSRLNTDGTMRIQRAVGAKGTVYLSIPGAKGGTGKVHVSVQGRMAEYKAITSYAELPTGAKIVVVKAIGSDTVEVSPAESLETSAHA